jgi:hypothetical protein
MNDLYYNKYLKYKNKYLELKYGGLVPYNYRKFYIDTNETITHPIYFKCEFISKLTESGYQQTNYKTIAAIVYLSGNFSFPQRKKEEDINIYRKRKKEYINQYPRIKWINLLWGDFKDIITYGSFIVSLTVAYYTHEVRLVKLESETQQDRQIVQDIKLELKEIKADIKELLKHTK